MSPTGIEDLSHIEDMKSKLRGVQRQRAAARVALDEDRKNPTRKRVFFALDDEYKRLVSQLSG